MVEGLAAPEEASTPKRLYSWLRHQHPHHRIVYIEGRGCVSFNIFPYLRATGVIPPSPPKGQRLAPDTELVELVWGDARQADQARDTNGGQEEYEHKYLMGADALQGGSVQEKLVNGYVEFVFEGTPMRLYRFDWVMGYTPHVATFLVWEGPSDEAGHKLVKNVYRWERCLQDEAWLFDLRWKKSKELFRSIQRARPQDIVLPDNILESLLNDVHSFFSSKARYEELGVAWKRGLLLVGPPGNGKTESIKAVLRAQKEQPFLYAKSFEAGANASPEQGICAVFEKARLASPCILVMEDLDSLVNEDTRSYLLNELDGLENNDGILVIATSNHPDRLDNAFSKRPSRFDTKYHFTNPSATQRKRFITKWLDEKLSNVNLGTRSKKDMLVEALVQGSSDWSYAFLKELFISFALVSAGATSNGGKVKGAGAAAEADTSPSSLLLGILAQLQSHISDEMEMDGYDD